MESTLTKMQILKLQRLERKTRRLDHNCLENTKIDLHMTMMGFGGFKVLASDKPDIELFRKRLLGQEALFKSFTNLH